MVLMKRFCFCCSVRLGVIVCATISIIQAFTTGIILLKSGLPILSSAKYFATQDELYNKDHFMWKMLDAFTENPGTYMALFQTVVAIHIIDSLLAVYGALKLRKWFLVPYAVSQSFVAVAGMCQHIITMMIVKNIVNLEMLIGYTLFGTFFMLFLAYSVTVAVSMFQIVVLINTEEYKALYGDDPFAPQGRSESRRRMHRDVEIFSISNKKETDCVKEMIRKQRETRKIMTVRAVGKSEENSDCKDVHFSNWHLNEVVGVGKNLK